MIGTTTLARPYAKAAFAVAQDSKDMDTWANALMALSEAIRAPEMENVLHNPTFSTEQVISIVTACVQKLNERMKNFLELLANNRRLSLLPAITTLFNEYKAEAEQQMTVQIISAFPLQEEQRAQFAKMLGKRLQKTVQIESTVDTHLIGGVIIHAGDHVIDGSVRGRLQQLNDSLMNG